MEHAFGIFSGHNPGDDGLCRRLRSWHTARNMRAENLTAEHGWCYNTLAASMVMVCIARQRAPVSRCVGNHGARVVFLWYVRT